MDQHDVILGEEFEQKRPPLSVILKTILQRYPDGQIFKEMIQNADDAGAKTVWFYIDERQHGVSNLPHPDLANFQGPALVAANDACFTEKDWEGIQSLQQSIKAEDPFKVGRFGIGFNSVYHVTDLPIIVSGDRLALFDPQHKLKGDKGGRKFPLKQLLTISSDVLSSVNGLAGFDPLLVCDKGYAHTIFRLPLRTTPSCLSENVYDVAKLLDLLEGLREESKYLLLFLKSVCKIEVIRIARSGKESLLFSVEACSDDVMSIKSDRDSFLQDLREIYDRQGYCISKAISYTSTFSVVVKDNTRTNNQSGTSKWLVANTVGSADTKIQEAASKQHTFPWVGAVLELGGKAVGGRVFCFLPMPMETSSGLPIHVNGTFGLNDERRSLKWPGSERRNDATANWNKILVGELLPPCYVMLLLEAKKYMSQQQFYDAWPDPKLLKKLRSEFVEILQPLYSSLFKLPVVWTEHAGQQTGEWIKVSKATFINEKSKDPLPSVLKPVLFNCGVQLVTTPPIIRKALEFVNLKVKEVSQMSVRAKLRSKPNSYSSVDNVGKKQILAYCLSDSCHNDLHGLNLLPLLSENFSSFDKQPVYLCSSAYPPSLLPNLQDKLVKLSGKSELEEGLQKSLYRVANSQRTKLKHLTEKEVASLIKQVFPSDWQRSSLVSMPHLHLPPTWLKTFWIWVKDKNLDLFKDQLLIPCYSSTSSSISNFHLAPLSIAQPVLFSANSSTCSQHVLSALYKRKVRVCIQNEFDFIKHKNLSRYVKQLSNGNNVLDAVASQNSYKNISFTCDEAEDIRVLLASSTPSLTLSSSRKAVLENLSIFSSASNSLRDLHSLCSASMISMINKPLGQSSNWIDIISHLPPNIIVFSCENHHQFKLLQSLKVHFPSDYALLTEYIFPLIRNGSFPAHLIDDLMAKVLDNFRTLNSREHFANFTQILQNFSFVRTKSSRKCPFSLFEPSDVNKALYGSEDVFPVEPYTMPYRIELLKCCCLQTTVTSQQIVDIIYSISYPARPTPQEAESTRLHRAEAVLRYISAPEFINQIREYVRLPEDSESIFFSKALIHLCTKRSWLPVTFKRPVDYPQELAWKGDKYPSHFVSLSSQNVIISTTDPCLVGSQAYVVSDNDLTSSILDILQTDSNLFTKHVINHFQVVLKSKELLSGEAMNSTVHKVYNYMNTQSDHCLKKLFSLKDWIYISRETKFVSPSVVSLEKNSTFKQDLEPFLYILPEPLSCYTRLFAKASGVQHTITQPQIVSILSAIKENCSCENVSAIDARNIVLAILNWITENGHKRVAEDILVPIESSLQWPQLEYASRVVFTNNEFMKTYLKESNEKDDYIFVHERVDPKLAASLQVQPLSELLDISEDTFEDAGQSESLLDRLVDILNQYKESGGLTIVKEMLQNADDAEATEVNICLDTRLHKTDPKTLYLPGMAKAHGPALLIHNNSTFTDEDFKNITKLAGRTKAKQNLKIGKFGIGFCSVYHMTDVPSFISRDKLFILDPTLTHLKKEVRDHSKPGKIIKFSSRFISGSNQLSPYDGLFGFDRHSEYQGTLFRLPFRTHQSDLSTTCYTEEKIKTLKCAIKQSAEKLLLFLQHVKRIQFQQIGPGETEPKILLTIQQNEIPYPISSCSSEIKIVKLTCQGSDSSKHCHWLVSKKSYTDNYQEKYYTASVACSLGSDTSGYKVNENFEGEMFCFLPLSQDIDIPVHISSNFAVMNNRRGIWTSSSKDSCEADEEVRWNINLMEGVIPKAYHSLLLGLKELAKNSFLKDYTFYSLWPKESLKQHHIWSNMLVSLYPLIENSSLFYSKNTQQWLSIFDGKFLSTDIFSSTVLVDGEKQNIYCCIMEVLKNLQEPLIDLPADYCNMIVSSTEIIDESTFIELFFEHYLEFDSISVERNFLIRFMLEIYASEYDDHTPRNYLLCSHLEKEACIPCLPDGRVFRMCNEIFDPRSEFAPLFDESDSHFPIKEISDRHLSRTALQKLGMIQNNIPWDILIERAETVPLLYVSNKVKALSRTRLIINANTEGELPVFGTTLDSIQFLPVISTPPSKNYPLKWKGKSKHLMSGPQLVRLKTNYDLIAGSQVHFVCESSEEGCGFISEKMLEILKIQAAPTVDEVVSHFKELIEYIQNQSNLSNELLSWTNKACESIYQFLNDKLHIRSSRHTARSSINLGASFRPAIVATEAKSDIDISSLTQLPCVWTGKNFVYPKMVVKQWQMTTSGPYIYSLPPILVNLSYFTQAVGIKNEIEFEDIQNVLHKMKDDFQERPVNEECQTLLADLVSPLLSILKPPNEVQVTSEDIFLPGEDFVLHSCQDLSFNDTPWLSSEDHYLYVNSMIPRTLATKLGIKTVRTKILDELSNPQNDFGIPFGQYEKLTDKIQGILREYPLDITIIKELLQNADDAKATKMFVILDTRQHGTDTILSKKWADLQGPALLVWNDSEFSEADLKGIQKLGVGSKRSFQESIGKFGIGFNVVYHLTDCPSFISGGDTMCVLDPHCRYVPGATLQKPGMRYDKLTEKGFWERFPDMKSVFLREKIPNAPDLSKGTLFRFPLRCTDKLLEESEIIDRTVSNNGVITSSVMNHKLTEWAPQMKHNLLFLNHICEVHFYEINESASGVSLRTLKHFLTSVDKAGKEKRGLFHSSVCNFSNSNNVPLVIKYPLKISEVSHYAYKTEEQSEKWLIQKGLGDLKEPNKIWINKDVRLKPIHGLAAPLELMKPTRQTESFYRSAVMSKATQVSVEQFKGQVFCFLPLPLNSNLPVHINGNLVLHANRRELWRTTIPGGMDNKIQWNQSLFTAIASSYADFLNNAQTDYVALSTYRKYHEALSDVDHYYEIFPSAKPKHLSEQYLELAQNMYKTLVYINAKILAVIEREQSLKGSQDLFKVTWHPIKSEDLASQVYFWTKSLQKELTIVIESIGMKLTRTPHKVLNCINAHMEDDSKLKQVSPEAVFQYYRQFSYQVCLNETFPCELKNTVFKNMASFTMFIKYLLQPSQTFPGYPFGCPLLVTADEILREFHQVDKVFNSKFYTLFPNSPNKFLHPNLLEVPLPEELFVSVRNTVTVGEVEQQPAICMDADQYSLVKYVLAQELPQEVQDAFVCTDYESLMSKENLQAFWECLMNDEIFNSFLSPLLGEFALLPATNGSLYSTNNPIKPIYALGTKLVRHCRYTVSESDITEAFQTLEYLGLPFLDSEIVCNASITSCATLFDVDIVLKHLCHLHKQDSLKQTFDKKTALALVDYFKAIGFQNNFDCLAQIKSLPLFENIDGTFTSLDGKKAYVWSNKVCDTGYQKWMRKYDNCVFLKPYSCWTKLGSSDDLKIKKLPAEKIYTDFIFPAFSELNEQERYDHLEQIKDHIFDECKRLVKNESVYAEPWRVQAACLFQNRLVDLPCIGGDNEPLLPVKSFCHDQVDVFRTFKTRYRFLPDKFKKSYEWLRFFENIGLRVSLTTDEFVDLCTGISRGEHEDLEEASKVLIKHLFSDSVRKKQKWHTNLTFLNKVASIPFVCIEEQPEYEWICPAAKPCNTVKSGDKCISMTKLCDATVPSQAHVLWTVKCVVSLPSYFSFEARDEYEQMLEHLKVTQIAKLSLVIQNIQNICALSQLTSQDLFDRYPKAIQMPEKGKDLVSVISHHFQLIDSECISTDDYNILAKLPCIPVYGSTAFKWQVVLVKPQCVVTTKCPELELLHPFIHLLPPSLASIDFLTKIGVHEELQKMHMQIVLEAAYDISKGDELDDNTKETVVECIKHLYSLLKNISEPEPQSILELENELKPLYLPTVDHKLCLSTLLVYADTPNYRVDMALDLSDTNYQELSMESALYKFSDVSFCNCLPDSLKPVGLSKISTMHIASSLREVEDSPVVQLLKNTLSLNILSKGCLSVVRGVTKQDMMYQKLETPIINFLSNIKVVSLQNLKTNVVSNSTDRTLGEARVPCFFENSGPGNSSSTLYIDSGLAEEEAGDEPVTLVLDHIMMIIETQNISFENLKEIYTILGSLLRAQSGERIRTILEKKGFDLDGIIMDRVEYSIGSEIPQCWKHRLDQNPDNIFRSGEKVGYEKSPGIVVFAEVLDPVLPKGCVDISSVARIEIQYTVFIKEDDEEGQVVSVLDLYKFLRSSQPVSEEQVPESNELLSYDGETYATRKSLQKEDIEDMKKELMEQLDKIWRLPEEDKQKAIKRLYLKWHPDKNLENVDVAEEIFKFLVSEIERRGSTKLPKAKWDSEAKTHGFYWRYEYSTPPSSSKGDRWGTSGGFSSSSSSQFGATSRSSGGSSTRGTYYPPFDRSDFQIRGNRVEGKRWLRQAMVDAKLLDIMFEALSSEPDIACGVCFQAHQVAEKSLKAGKIYVLGLSEKALKTTKLLTHAYGLQKELGHKASDLASLVSPLEDYLQKTRYPDLCDPPSIPATVFTCEQATVAVQNAKKILSVIQTIVV